LPVSVCYKLTTKLVAQTKITFDPMLCDCEFLRILP
jgi:hypothetical protein